jgi:hypothetical protein
MGFCGPGIFFGGSFYRKRTKENTKVHIKKITKGHFIGAKSFWAGNISGPEYKGNTKETQRKVLARTTYRGGGGNRQNTKENTKENDQGKLWRRKKCLGGRILLV